MCDKATLENGGTLKYVSDYYKNNKVCVIKLVIVILLQ